MPRKFVRKRKNKKIVTKNNFLKVYTQKVKPDLKYTELVNPTAGTYVNLGTNSTTVGTPFSMAQGAGASERVGMKVNAKLVVGRICLNLDTATANNQGWVRIILFIDRNPVPGATLAVADEIFGATGDRIGYFPSGDAVNSRGNVSTRNGQEKHRFKMLWDRTVALGNTSGSESTMKVLTFRKRLNFATCYTTTAATGAQVNKLYIMYMTNDFTTTPVGMLYNIRTYYTDD